LFAPLPPAKSWIVVSQKFATMEDETREADQGPQLISIISEDPVGEEQGTLRVSEKNLPEFLDPFRTQTENRKFKKEAQAIQTT